MPKATSSRSLGKGKIPLPYSTLHLWYIHVCWNGKHNDIGWFDYFQNVMYPSRNGNCISWWKISFIFKCSWKKWLHSELGYTEI